MINQNSACKQRNNRYGIYQMGLWFECQETINWVDLGGGAHTKNKHFQNNYVHVTYQIKEKEV